MDAPIDAGEVLEDNEGRQLSTDVPRYFGFGCSGVGEMLAFDTRGNGSR